MTSSVAVLDEGRCEGVTTRSPEADVTELLNVAEYLAVLRSLVGPPVGEAGGGRDHCTLAVAVHSRALRRPRLAVVGVGLLAATGTDADHHAVASEALASAIVRDGAAVQIVLLDDHSVLASWLDRYARQHDLVVVVGDLHGDPQGGLRGLLAERASGRVADLRVEPLQRHAWGRWDGDVPLVVLPVDGGSATIAYELLIRPLVDHLLGRETGSWGTAVASCGWVSTPGRLQVVPVRLHKDRRRGALLAQPATAQGVRPGSTASLDHADVIVTVDEELTEVVPGLRLPVRWLR